MQSLIRSADAVSTQVSSRRSLLGRGALAGIATLPVVGYFTSSAKAAPQQSLDASSREAFRDIQSHENDHVAKIRGILGRAARPKPTFKNLTSPNYNTFVETARIFENVGVGAYLAALPAITSKEYVAFAGSVALIEARHAGFLNVFAGKDVSLQARDNAPSAVDRPLTIGQIQTAVTPYIASLNGGPAATFTAGNDISIVNFALLLEYLEAEFYNINVPKFINSTPV